MPELNSNHSASSEEQSKSKLDDQYSVIGLVDGKLKIRRSSQSAYENLRREPERVENYLTSQRLVDNDPVYAQGANCSKTQCFYCWDSHFITVELETDHGPRDYSFKCLCAVGTKYEKTPLASILELKKYYKLQCKLSDNCLFRNRQDFTNRCLRFECDNKHKVTPKSHRITGETS